MEIFVAILFFIAVLALLLGGLTVWAWTSWMEGRVGALEATLREHGIYRLKDPMGGVPYDPPLYRPAPSGETPSPPRGGTGTTGYRPSQPTSRPSGPAPEPPPTPTGRA